MRIFFLTSFYSGLRASIYSGEWKPTGMPAMYKLLERLNDKEIKFDYCFVDRRQKTTKEYHVKLFQKNKFFVLGVSPKNRFLNAFRKIIFKPLYLIKVYRFLKKINADQYDVFYIDRANINAFLIVHYFFKAKSVLRLHGVGLLYTKFKSSKYFLIKNYLSYKAFKLPFKTIIASRDGTQVQEFLKYNTNKNSNKFVMLNGVDVFSESISLDKGKNRIDFLFVGRLEKDKGIIEVIEAFKLLQDNRSICLNIIGGGSLENHVKENIKTQKNIKYLGTLPHNKVQELYASCDVFISLNHLGNLSNVVLEAVKSNLLIITFRKDLEKEKDIESNSFLEDCALYIDRYNASSSLAEVIESLLEKPQKVSEYRNKVKKDLSPKIVSWNERIDKEIEIILNSK